MALPVKLFVIYHTGTGRVVRAEWHPEGEPPSTGGPLAVMALDDVPDSGFPSARTHVVDAGPPPTLVARSAQDQQADADAETKLQMEREIGQRIATRDGMVAQGYDVTAINQEIADAIAEHDAL